MTAKQQKVSQLTGMPEKVYFAVSCSDWHTSAEILANLKPAGFASGIRNVEHCLYNLNRQGLVKIREGEGRNGKDLFLREAKDCKKARPKVLTLSGKAEEEPVPEEVLNNEAASLMTGISADPPSLDEADFNELADLLGKKLQHIREATSLVNQEIGNAESLLVRLMETHDRDAVSVKKVAALKAALADL